MTWPVALKAVGLSARNGIKLRVRRAFPIEKASQQRFPAAVVSLLCYACLIRSSSHFIIQT